MSENSDQVVFFGNNGWNEISSYLDTHGINSILLVTGRDMFSDSGAKEKLTPIFEGKNVTRVSDFETNPKVEDIQSILDSLPVDMNYDAIIAVGGGSVMDVSKLIKAYANSNLPVVDCIHGNEPLTPAVIPLIAVPTTAGSGSEATHFAVVYHGQEKFSIAHEALRPNVAVVIPSLLESLPSNIAAASGMDALCQGIESYWSIYSTGQSRAIAKEAITLAWGSLKEAVLENSPRALDNISRSSHLAGRAINLTKTTAPHAVSYALTTFYGVLHGHAVGLLVPHFFAYNASVSETDCLDPRGSIWVNTTLQEIAELLGCASPSEVRDAMLGLMKTINLETDIGKLGVINANDIEVVVKNGFNPQRVNNNPRQLTEEALRDLLTEMISV